VWGEECTAYDCGDEAARWLSHVLALGSDEEKEEEEEQGQGQENAYPLRLVRMAALSVFQRAAELHGTVSFADQYPLLLTSRESLCALNNSLAESGQVEIPMARFRPNIIICGTSGSGSGALVPYCEDMWKVVGISASASASAATTPSSSSGNSASKIGKAVIQMDIPYPPCARCKVPTVDTETARMHPQNQPTKVMQQVRSGTALGMGGQPKLAKHVFFGIHMATASYAPEEQGQQGQTWTESEMVVRVGDVVSALEVHVTLSR